MVRAYCNLCGDFTPHDYTTGRCFLCIDKDKKDVEEALERIRKAEGADLDPTDIFDAGTDL